MSKIGTDRENSAIGARERNGAGWVIDGQNLTLKSVTDLVESNARLELAPEALEAVNRSRAIVEARATGEKALYGINTGFGALAHERIPAKDLQRLQQNLILSHAVGAGDEVSPEIVALMLLFKANGLAVGLSGVRPAIIEYLIRFYNEGVYPIVYTKGSLGASGDLAPLAHLTLPMIGMGEVYRSQVRMPAATVLKDLELAPLHLEAKEGLALINGTQFMTAYAVHCLIRIQQLLVTADVVAAMTLESIRGSAAPFDARIHDARPHPGQKRVAARMRQLLRGSQILPSHIDCPKVQDPYSVRCVPQVHGAVWEAFEHARQVIERELNSATDNPLVFENGDIVSGGNFHGELLAFVLDYLAIGTAELASISERRLFLLLGGDTLGEIKLPKLLMKDTGLNSGFMLPQYLAAALVSENKIFAHPASVDSIPSSLGQEDHVSMGATSATKLLEVVKNTETVLAIELMSAAQALDFIHPLKAGEGVESAHTEFRKHISFAESDRLFHDDIQVALGVLRSGSVVKAAETAVGSL
ncbi:MAG TPA: histidine ammonia-lyase [Chthoniobacterales bacterium]|nr:histidine ammonia-lyase [Chthoniobacterales bacterium]